MSATSPTFIQLLSPGVIIELQFQLVSTLSGEVEEAAMYESASPKKNCPDDQEVALTQIRADLIGRLDPVKTPFGCKPLVCECSMLPKCCPQTCGHLTQSWFAFYGMEARAISQVKELAHTFVAQK